MSGLTASAVLALVGVGIAASAPLIGAAIELGPETAAYVGVGGALALLFRIVVKSLTTSGSEMSGLVRQMRQERDRAQRRERWQASRADHWYAVALGDPHPPQILPEPADDDVPVDPAGK